MDFLLQLDRALQQWINVGWSNPVLDPVMRFFSSNRYFMPFAVVLALVVLWRNRLRGALFLLCVAAGLGFGDGFLYPAIKNAVARPRPYEVVEGTVLRVGATKSGSMPSSHAGNWMCLAVAAGIFYRRSLWVTLPLTAVVGLSRIYNGVHFPSDVLAGMVLGGGCGVTMVIALNWLWNWVGRRWFPMWHEMHPSLLYRPPIERGNSVHGEQFDPSLEPEPEFRGRGEKGPTVARHVSIDEHWLHLGYILLVLTMGARLWFLAGGSLQLTPDEAYQWNWSRHLDISYYSKPPFIAYAQFLGTGIWGDTQFGVRFFSPVISAILGLLVLRFISRVVNARAAFFLLLILSTTPILAAGSILMTIDPLSVLFWTAAMITGWRAIQDKSTWRDWALTGFWMGMGFLSKYTALFQLLCWAVLFVLYAPARKQLRRPGPWLALIIMVICTLPVVYWNAQHDWITVKHVAEDAGAGKVWKPTAKYFLEFLGSELGLMNPIYFLATCWAAFAFWKRGRQNPRLVYFFSMGAPLFLVYFAFTLKSRVEPNWIAPSIIPLFCMALVYWDQEVRLGRTRIKRWLYAGLALGAVAVIFAHETDLIQKTLKFQVPAKSDPLRRGRAWVETATMVGNFRNKILAEGKPVFVIGDHYGITGELSFYMPESKARPVSDPLVYCVSSPTPRNQFNLWPGYTNHVGENAVFIRELNPSYKEAPPPPPILRRQFESVEEFGVLPVTRWGHKEPVRYLQLFICRNLKPQ